MQAIGAKVTSLSPMAAYLYGSRGNLCLSLCLLCVKIRRKTIWLDGECCRRRRKKKRFRNILLNFFTGWPNFFQSFLFFFSIVCTAKQTVLGFERDKKWRQPISLLRWMSDDWITKGDRRFFCSVGLVQIDWLLTAVITGCSSHVRKSISPIFGGEGFFSPVWR